jgi:hypothetical protein
VPKVVADTVVYVRAIFNPRGACGRTLLGYADSVDLVLSPPLIDEIVDVLARPSMVRRFARRNPEYTVAISNVLAALSRASIVTISDVPSVERDPNDDMVLATAVVSGAEYLVTEDKDLLVLDGHAGIRICTCREFMALAETGLG